MQTQIQTIEGGLTKAPMTIGDHGFDVFWRSPLKELNG
jgi:hypothetical protein